MIVHQITVSIKCWQVSKKSYLKPMTCTHPELVTATTSADKPYPSKVPVPDAITLRLETLNPGPRIRSPTPAIAKELTEELLLGMMVILMALLVVKPCSKFNTKTPLPSTVKPIAFMTSASAVMTAVLLLSTVASWGRTSMGKGRQDRIEWKAGSCSVVFTGDAAEQVVVVANPITVSRRTAPPYIPVASTFWWMMQTWCKPDGEKRLDICNAIIVHHDFEGAGYLWHHATIEDFGYPIWTSICSSMSYSGTLSELGCWGSGCMSCCF